jgi:hypothetical protein
MRWVRNPWWDGFWLLSGLPIGIMLMLFSPGMVMPLAVAVMVLESAHIVSPLILAWTRPELRAIVSREWIKHIAAPAAIMAGVLLFPALWVMWVYWAWNIYHFGMQNFGVTSLYWRPNRELRKWACLGLTAFGMGVVPYLTHNLQISMLCMGIFGFNHWLTDIGLSSRVARWHWGFIAMVPLIGVAWLLLRNGPLSVHLVPQILAIRAGIGMIHFVYSARIWKFSDPQVRAAIGRDVFGPPPLRLVA